MESRLTLTNIRRSTTLLSRDDVWFGNVLRQLYLSANVLVANVVGSDGAAGRRAALAVATDEV
jgi:hypothetical protein